MRPTAIIACGLAAFTAFFVVPAKADCGCSGNPGTLTEDASGPCLRYEAPSGASNDVTFRFDSAYACGQYATGEYFVVAESGGHATIEAVLPAASGGFHGIDVNPSPSGQQRWDHRLPNYAAPTITFPYAAAPGSSVVKYVSDNPGTDECDNDDNGPDQKSCGRFAAVVTILDASPANPATRFRPPFVGTNKPSLSTTDLQTQLLSRLPGSCCADKLSREVAEAWTRHLRLDYTDDSVSCDIMPPEDALPEGRPWSTDIWAHDTDVLEWLQLGDVCDAPPCSPDQDIEAKRATLIGFVQHGIDVWATNKMGASLFRGGGGNGGGKLLTYAFAATMLADAEMLSDLAAIKADDFFESGSYYAGENGVALWGQRSGSEDEYWSDLANPPGDTKTIRDPYGYIDGGGELGGQYQDNTAKPTKYTALLMRLMPALAKNWPINGDVILAYADRWVSVGAWAQPDPCAPPQGSYGSDYGPDGNGGCILDSDGVGRVPDQHGANKDGGNRGRAFGEQMWAAFRDCAESCSCPEQSCEMPSGSGAGGGGGGTTSSGGGNGEGPAGGGGAGANPGDPPPDGGDAADSSGGCGCQTANANGATSAAWLAFVAAAVVLRRPRRGAPRRDRPAAS